MTSPIDFSRPWDGGDVCFIVNDTASERQTIYANMGVLEVWSPVFKEMFGLKHYWKGEKFAVELKGKVYGAVLELMEVLHPPNKQVSGESKCFV